QRSGGVGFESDGTEIVACGNANVGTEGGGEAAKQGDGGLGAAFLDALDLVGGHAGAQREFGDGQLQRGAPVVDGFAERKGLPDGDPLRVAGVVVRQYPSGVVAGHRASLSHTSTLPTGRPVQAGAAVPIPRQRGAPTRVRRARYLSRRAGRRPRPR